MEELLHYLKTKNPKLCAMATSSNEGKPSCAIVAYAVLDDLTLILSTRRTSRKWSNLQVNPSIALAIGWSFAEMFVQYDGTVELVTEGDEFSKLETNFYEQNPETKKFKGPDTAFIKVKPTRIRISDFSKQPPVSKEIAL